jgi:hypothetical protein
MDEGTHRRRRAPSREELPAERGREERARAAAVRKLTGR